MNAVAAAPDLAERISIAEAKAATPAYDRAIDPEEVDIEAWDHVGDPLAENLILALRERKLMGGDLLTNARTLRDQSVEVAEAFFSDIEWTPDWVDFGAMRPGAVMGLRNPIGMMLGAHGALPFTYADGATARVMASTNRFLRPDMIRRRFWETATGFIGALDVDGMQPGGARWEQWVRIRLLHTSIRMGILRSGRWDTAESMPISQAPTASGAHIFGAYRLNVIRHFGGKPTQDEAYGFELMWRWIARLQGANVELLGTTPAEQLRLAERIGDHIYRPSHESQVATAALIDGFTKMKSVFPVSRRAHAGITRRILSEEMTQILGARPLADDLGLHANRRTDSLASVVTGMNRGLARIIDLFPSKPESDLRLMDAVVTRGLDRRPATFAPTAVAGDPG